jgi:hypothetical protein
LSEKYQEVGMLQQMDEINHPVHQKSGGYIIKVNTVV